MQTRHHTGYGRIYRIKCNTAVGFARIMSIVNGASSYTLLGYKDKNGEAIIEDDSLPEKTLKNTRDLLDKNSDMMVIRGS